MVPWALVQWEIGEWFVVAATMRARIPTTEIGPGGTVRNRGLHNCSGITHVPVGIVPAVRTGGGPS